jgi:hypothetical protein
MDECRSRDAARGEGAGMRFDLLGSIGPDAPEAEVRREIGAVVARASPNGGLTIELGPADGAPLLRLGLSKVEAHRLRGALEAILTGRDEEIVITDT